MSEPLSPRKLKLCEFLRSAGVAWIDDTPGSDPSATAEAVRLRAELDALLHLWKDGAYNPVEDFSRSHPSLSPSQPHPHDNAPLHG